MIAMWKLAGLALAMALSEQATDKIPAAQIADPAAVESAAALLEKIEAKHGEITSFRAGFSMEKHRELEDETERRIGRIIVHGPSGPKRRFAVVVDQQIDSDGRGSPDKRRFVYSDGWLSEIDISRKQLIRRQLAKEGEALDPLKVGEGPFPLPLGQKKADVLREFQAATCVAPSTALLSSARAEGVVSIALVPREGTPLARDTTQIVVSYDRSTLLPVAIEVQQRSGDRTSVLVRQSIANAELTAEETSLLDLGMADGPDWTRDERPLAYRLSPSTQDGPTIGQAERPGSGSGALVPDSVQLAPAVRAAVDAPWLSEDQRRQMRIDHGVWLQGDLDTPDRRALAAIRTWVFDDPSVLDPQVDPLLRASAFLQRGDSVSAVAAVDLALGRMGAATPDAETERECAQRTVALQTRASALEESARFSEAIDSARGAVSAGSGCPDDAAAVAAVARAVAILGRLQGVEPAQYESVMKSLGHIASEIDKADWQVRLVEAEILMEKHNPSEAVPAVHEALRCNPRCADAWYLLGRLANMQFDFDGADRAAGKLDELAPAGPLGALLRAETALRRGDGDLALQSLKPLLASAPLQRRALELRAGAFAIDFDEAAMRTALADYELLAPGSGRAYLEAGDRLGAQRQYEIAAELLEESARREPSNSAPQLALGLLEMQTGRDARALPALRRAIELDPFNQRAVFSLELQEMLEGWSQLTSQHFVLRFKPGVDEALARGMLEPLEAMHSEVAARYQWEPSSPTLIELHPDHASFAVRITGMPSVHTIAASTGPVIALEAPKEAAPRKHQGLFDWLDVVRHEYTHTITLGKTRNRIPHWLTEAVAVDMEQKARDFQTYELLARSLQTDQLFDMEEINWAFVRPKRPEDRALAYSQGHWMVQYLSARFGLQALPQLLALYAQGVTQPQAFAQVLEVSEAEFLAGFKEWAKGEVVQWGFSYSPSLAELTAPLGLDSETPALDDSQLAALLARYPEHPDLLEISIRRKLRDSAADANTIALLERYAKARPVDAYPHRKLAEALLEGDSPESARPHLEALDRLSERVNAYALELVSLHRKAGRRQKAVECALRAVRIDPYSAPTRELAATVAIEAGDFDLAKRQLESLTLLEPSRELHKQRLKKLEEMASSRQPSITPP